MKKLSIVIPAHNVDAYISKCIHSCLNQDINSEDYEIVIINDGSTDNTLEIIQNFERCFQNFTIVSQENLGTGIARNVGLSRAKGEYIWFIDADDWISPNCLSNILKKLSEIDILAMGCVRVSDNFEDFQENVTKNSQISNGIDLLKKNKFKVPVHLYIFRKDFLIKKALLFQPFLFEDLEFTPRALYLAQTLKVYDNLVYFRYNRPGSFMNTPNPKQSFDLLNIALNFESFNSKFVNKKHKFIFYNLIAVTVNNSIFYSLKTTNKVQKDFRLYLYKNKSIYKYLLSARIIKYKIEGLLFYLFPRYTVSIYKLMKLLG